MKNSKTISETMAGDHALIEVLISLFKGSLAREDAHSKEKSFQKFRWELEKHIFVEEKVIFRFSASSQSENDSLIQGLVEGHDIMLDIVSAMESDLSQNNDLKDSLSKLENLLDAHRKTEEETLYPRLDRELPEVQKEIIIARINEIPIKKDADLI